MINPQVRISGQYVRLPISAESPTSEPLATQQDVVVKTSGFRILVVDDNKAAAEMLSTIVKMLGNEVRTASDGEQADDDAGRPDRLGAG